jgi:hypothetical protein
VDHNRFVAVTQSLISIPSRRHLLRGLAGAGLGLGVARLPGSAEAKKKGKKKPRKGRPNAFGCLEVGDPCRNAAQCCSGICKGKKGVRRCRAHDTGTCKQDGVLAPCNNRTNCGCFRTTAGSDICAELFPPSDCAECQRDADCLDLGFPAGSACGPGPCEGGMACYVPCGAEIPDPETP